VNQEKGADTNFLEGARQTRQHVVTLILTLDRLATAEQRNHILEKLDELIQTIHGLSKI
jgi:hypothetical protein